MVPGAGAELRGEDAATPSRPPSNATNTRYFHTLALIQKRWQASTVRLQQSSLYLTRFLSMEIWSRIRGFAECVLDRTNGAGSAIGRHPEGWFALPGQSVIKDIQVRWRCHRLLWPSPFGLNGP